MRIIRPYGESRTEGKDGHSFSRVLYQNDQARSRHEITDFAVGHSDLVIAQWISVIDKIATKPTGDRGATKEQREFRNRLGKAAWHRLCAANRIPVSAQTDTSVEAVWNFKIHPYGSATYKGGAKQPDPRGRWYARFAGDASPEGADADAIARKIDSHLYEAAMRLNPDSPVRSKGQIELRARSIAKNTLALSSEKRGKQPNVPSTYEDADKELYFQRCDIAQEIYMAAKACETEHSRPFRLSDAAKLLSAHWSRVFGDDVQTMEQAIEKAPGCLALHLAIRDVYRAKLKRRTAPARSKTQKGSAPRQTPAAQILPKSKGALLELIKQVDSNREVADVIRRGKLVHYTAADLVTDDADRAEADDTTAGALTHWPQDLSRTRYRTSEGQSAIKRSEAFVRIWRHTIALAALTLRDWASMKRGDIGDVLGEAEKAAGCKNFDRDAQGRKVRLLFGSRADEFSKNDDAQKDLLRSAIRIATKLRNSCFHFTGRKGFISALEGLAEPEIVEPNILKQAIVIWKMDKEDRGRRIRAGLTAVHANSFFDRAENADILAHLEAEPDADDLPIPRFGRVLLRAQNTWKGKDKLLLPEAGNRVEYEANPAARCRYVVLKALYERPFRNWISQRPTDEVTAWIRKAVVRSTQAAKSMNAKGDTTKQAMIVSRAEKLLNDREWDVDSFFAELSRATASEMRVQRGYGHDGEAARDQAEYIDEVLCDVVALAFDAWLKQENLAWIVQLAPATPLPDTAKCQLDDIGSTATIEDPENWEAALYLFLHLVPVAEAARLRHQLAKWKITSTLDDNELSKEDAYRLQKLESTLVLHLDMHDAKFEGGDTLTGCDEFKQLYAPQSAFDRIFPSTSDDRLVGLVPKRGLREIMRFGHRGLMSKVAMIEKITDKEVDDYLRAETETGPDSVVALQKQREEAHAKWVNGRERKGNFTPDDCKSYVEAVRGVAVHRRLGARATLTDQVELHRMLMSVLGRLVDYSGLFERDLYFATLGLIHAAGQTPADVFSGSPGLNSKGKPDGGLGLLARGQIFSAWRDENLKSNSTGKPCDDAKKIKQQLEALFGKDRSGRTLFGGSGTLQALRNDLAHFNCLHGGDDAPDLSKLVNETRVLMSYDRKLKNAVSKSIKELLAREGYELEWQMSHHVLRDAKVGAKRAVHLGNKKIYDGYNNDWRMIEECLKSQFQTAQLAHLFSGQSVALDDITSCDLARIEWARKNEKNRGRTHQTRPGGKQKTKARRRKNRAYIER
ncbi:type VI-A CRISPR-associated RNA-guided ribonuclease Cas13a [Rhodobacteraceae bacterium G21628-S1]|nr:type VI-A CRISPR-associated RNA-guided ribonuclease Cas13a [Rhodobacteraceae bacterium G21628-S1]